VLLNSTVAETDSSQSTNLSVLENLLDVPIIAIERDQNDFGAIIRKLDWKTRLRDAGQVGAGFPSRPF
jgi:hypothetical protein